MKRSFFGFQCRDQDLEAFDAPLVGGSSGQAAVMVDLRIDLLAFPAHVNQPVEGGRVPIAMVVGERLKVRS
jgi:hypothetical protein